MSRKIDIAYGALSAWLTRADENYMGGRFLSRAGSHLVGGNVCWLAFEQLAKILILQRRIYSMPLPESPPNKRSEDLTAIFGLLDDEAKRIHPHHEAEPLLREMAQEYPDLDLSLYKPTIAKLQQFFSMRYYKEGKHQFSRQEIDLIDAFYFLMRDRVVLDIGMGVIDTLLLLRLNGKLYWRSVIHKDLFDENKAIRPRSGCAAHPKFCMGWAGPGMTVAETLHFPG